MWSIRQLLRRLVSKLLLRKVVCHRECNAAKTSEGSTSFADAAEHTIGRGAPEPNAWGYRVRPCMGSLWWLSREPPD